MAGCAPRPCCSSPCSPRSPRVTTIRATRSWPATSTRRCWRSAAPPATTCGRSAPTAGAARWCCTTTARAGRASPPARAATCGGSRRSPADRPTSLARTPRSSATTARRSRGWRRRGWRPTPSTGCGPRRPTTCTRSAAWPVAQRLRLALRRRRVARRPGAARGPVRRRVRRRGRLLQGVGWRRWAAVGGRRARGRAALGRHGAGAGGDADHEHAVHRAPGRRPRGGGRRRHRRRARRAAGRRRVRRSHAGRRRPDPGRVGDGGRRRLGQRRARRAVPPRRRRLAGRRPRPRARRRVAARDVDRSRWGRLGGRRRRRDRRARQRRARLPRRADGGALPAGRAAAAARPDLSRRRDRSGAERLDRAALERADPRRDPPRHPAPRRPRAQPVPRLGRACGTRGPPTTPPPTASSPRRDRHRRPPTSRAARGGDQLRRYRVLSHRYAASRSAARSARLCFDAFMDELGYPIADTTTTGDGAARSATASARRSSPRSPTTAPTRPTTTPTPRAGRRSTRRWSSIGRARCSSIRRSGSRSTSPRPRPRTASSCRRACRSYIGTNWRWSRRSRMRRPDEPAYTTPGTAAAWPISPRCRRGSRRSAAPQARSAAARRSTSRPARYGNNPLGTNDGTATR
jgi:hypothetical protein